jgi:hypothetical protein
MGVSRCEGVGKLGGGATWMGHIFDDILDVSSNI